MEIVICVVGFVLLIYFTCRPKRKRVKDNLTVEIRPKGLPSDAPWNSWIPPQ